MFGYPAAFANGHLFAGLHQADLMLRLADEARARLLALPGARHFEPLPGRRMRAYAVVPRSLHADRRALRRWMAQAFADALSLPPKRGARPR